MAVGWQTTLVAVGLPRHKVDIANCVSVVDIVLVSCVLTGNVASASPRWARGRTRRRLATSRYTQFMEQ